MPDLHIDAVHAFWDSYDRRTLYRIVVALEKVEHWAIDKIPQVEAALFKLAEVIDESYDLELSQENKLIRILVNTRAGRALRLLQALDSVKPGSASSILMYAEEVNKEGQGDRHAKLFLRRNLVFERLQLLTRVFSPPRLSLVLTALEEQDD